MKRKRITKTVAEALAIDVSNKLINYYNSCEEKIVKDITKSKDYKKLIALQDKMSADCRKFESMQSKKQNEVEDLKETIIKNCNMPIVDIIIRRDYNKGVKVKYSIPDKELIVGQLLVQDYFVDDKSTLDQVVSKTIDKILEIRKEVRLTKI
jgi:hypothetical protein